MKKFLVIFSLIFLTSCNKEVKLIKPKMCPQGLHLENNQCVENFKYCSLQSEPGISYWGKDQWGPCLSFCDPEIFSCPLNPSRSCYIENGEGISYLGAKNGGTWSSCKINYCNEDFHQESQVCIANERFCPLETGFGYQIFNKDENRWNDCFLYCDPFLIFCGYTFEFCPIENGKGKRFFNNGYQTTCLISSCNENFYLNPSGDSCLLSDFGHYKLWSYSLFSVNFTSFSQNCQFGKCIYNNKKSLLDLNEQLVIFYNNEVVLYNKKTNTDPLMRVQKVLSGFFPIDENNINFKINDSHLFISLKSTNNSFNIFKINLNNYDNKSLITSSLGELKIVDVLDNKITFFNKATKELTIKNLTSLEEKIFIINNDDIIEIIQSSDKYFILTSNSIYRLDENDLTFISNYENQLFFKTSQGSLILIKNDAFIKIHHGQVFFSETNTESFGNNFKFLESKRHLQRLYLKPLNSKKIIVLNESDLSFSNHEIINLPITGESIFTLYEVPELNDEYLKITWSNGNLNYSQDTYFDETAFVYPPLPLFSYPKITHSFLNPQLTTYPLTKYIFYNNLFLFPGTSELNKNTINLYKSFTLPSVF